MQPVNIAEEVIRVKDQFYILATSSLADRRTQVLKCGDSFAVFDRQGDIGPIGHGVQGLYHEGTRFLSRLVLKLEGDRPMLLSSSVNEDNMVLGVDLTNSDLVTGGNVVLPRGTLHLSREKFLQNATCYERLTITNYSPSPVAVSMSVQFEADFADVFEVRGIRRDRRGRRLGVKIDEGELVLCYEGLDGTIRRSRIRCWPPPARVNPGELQFELALNPNARAMVFLTVACESEPQQPPQTASFEKAFRQAECDLESARGKLARVHTSNEQFNDWLNRSSADLRMLVTDTPQGPYPYAGVPWFSTAFGRDGIITALETLWIDPEMAHSVLQYLASTQATEVDPEVDAEPGKILHETRSGEMARLKEVPFARYYGSVDATPLFVALAGAYFERTGDLKFIENIWPKIELALRWIDEFGDLDGDGFVEYTRRSATGLEQQGWKDSRDSVFHANGTLAEPPIALCEVQGYVYAARQRAAELAWALGRDQQAAQLHAQADQLRDNFERAFWCEDISAYALALDRDKRPCRVRASNAGHSLFTGIAFPEHARRTAETLLEPDMFTGWGIRTISSQALRYNPMSYHNGSVWPHDNALIAWGMARHGLGESVVRVFTGMFDAAIFLELHRMPELFCGFARVPGKGPTLYPIACSPQAWSAASVYMLLSACLGVSISAMPPQIRFTRAVLPESVPQILIENLKVADSSVDLSISRFRGHITVNILRRDGNVDIVSFT
jgi:glycogen debranching enzyme